MHTNKIKDLNLRLNLEKASHERRSYYFSHIFSDFRYGKEIRSYQLCQWILTKYEHQLNAMQQIYNKISINGIKNGSMTAITGCIQQSIIYFYLTFKVLKQLMTIGDFSMYLNAISKFNNMFQSIIYAFIDLNQYTTYYIGFEKFLSEQPQENNTLTQFVSIDTNNMCIEFKNVWYKYEGQNFYSLKNVNLKVMNNEKIAIIGENGSGKSTFIKLLTRIYTPTKGEILVNGININNINLDIYSKLFSTVFQDFKLFSMSLKDNITLTKTPCNEASLKEICSKIGLAPKIDALSNGIDTFIYKDFDTQGFEPSGGEAQKIAICRALYQDAPIVILDEPTAALDPRAEYELYNQFTDILKNKTVFYVSHRLSVTKFSHKILVFNEGEIKESGSHNELINDSKIYKELFEIQSQYYI